MALHWIASLSPDLYKSLLLHLPLARRKLAPPADDVHHVGQLVRRAVLRPAALVAVVRLPRAPLVLAAAVLNVDHTVLLVGRAVPRTLAVLPVGRLPRALVELAPGVLFYYEWYHMYSSTKK